MKKIELSIEKSSIILSPATLPKTSNPPWISLREFIEIWRENNS